VMKINKTGSAKTSAASAINSSASENFRRLINL
jgi:hypothetical protein